MATTSHLSNIEFVLNEVIRFSQVSFEDLKTLSFEDTLSSLPHPIHQGGMLICGQQAIKKLYESAEFAIEKDRSKGRLDPEKVVRDLKQILVDWFIAEERSLTDQMASKAVSRAIKLSKQRALTATFLIPCHLFEGGNTTKFKIGPITFRRTERYFDRDAHEVIESANKEKEDLFKTIKEKAIKYYKSFNWIALVKLEKTDLEMGRAHAAKMVQSALDCFQLILGTRHSYRMRVGGPNAAFDQRGTIELIDSKGPQFSSSGTHHDHHMPNDWWLYFKEKGDDKTSHLMGLAIAEAYKYSDQSSLSRRFLEAAAWYGEAARDKFTASRLIKFVTAIERIVTTKSEMDLTDTIAKRGAALICTRYDVKYEAVKKEIKKVYDARSRLVHGQVSPDDTRTTSALVLTEKLSRAIIIAAIGFYREAGITEKGVSLKKIDREYNSVVSIIEKRSKEAVK